MTPVLAKYFWLACVIAWWLIRFPYERRARKAKVSASRRDARELILLGISLTGLGIIPIIYVFTGFPAAANRSFVPLVAWLGIIPALGSLWLFWRTHRELGRNWSVSLEVRDKHELITGRRLPLRTPPNVFCFFPLGRRATPAAAQLGGGSLRTHRFRSSLFCFALGERSS